MKVLGFVIIVFGLIFLYVGITGSQHTLMATLKGSTNAVQSGKNINPSGSSSTTPTTNIPPQTVAMM